MERYALALTLLEIIVAVFLGYVISLWLIAWAAIRAVQHKLGSATLMLLLAALFWLAAYAGNLFLNIIRF